MAAGPSTTENTVLMTAERRNELARSKPHPDSGAKTEGSTNDMTIDDRRTTVIVIARETALPDRLKGSPGNRGVKHHARE